MAENNEEQKPRKKNKLVEFHDKYYKHLLLIPLILLILSISYIGFFYASKGEFIHKDISLTGGTVITLFGKINPNELKIGVSGHLGDVSVREISDFLTGEQKAVIIETTSGPSETKKVLENYLGYTLNEDNSSIEFTGSSLSEGFFNQLLIAVIIAFSFMGWVIFLIFGKNLKIKMLVGTIIFANAFLSFGAFSSSLAIISSLIVLLFTIILYLFYSIPSIAIVLSAFADILMTLAMLNLLGIKISTAGIVALLMLIGYSVDTDILLTNKVLKDNEGTLNRKIYSALVTGLTMTFTSIFALAAALFVVSSFSDILAKIFTILLIGLGFDLINTWITNVSILKWHILKKEK